MPKHVNSKRKNQHCSEHDELVDMVLEPEMMNSKRRRTQPFLDPFLATEDRPSNYEAFVGAPVVDGFHVHILRQHGVCELVGQHEVDDDANQRVDLTHFLDGWLPNDLISPPVKYYFINFCPHLFL